MRRIRLALNAIAQGLTRQQKQGIIWLVDASLAPLAFLVTCMIVYTSVWPAAQLVRLAPIFGVLTLLAGLASLAVQLPRIKLKSYDSFVMLGMLPYAAAVGAGTLILTQLSDLTFPIIGTVTFTLVLFVASVAIRMVMLNIFLWVLRSGKSLTRVLIYGAGATGLQLASALKGHETIVVKAFVDDSPALAGQKLAGLRVHPAARIAELVRSHDITRVILAIPSASPPRQAQIGRRMQELGLDVQVLPSFAQLVGAEALVDTLTPLPADQFLGRDHLDASLPDRTAAWRDQTVMVTGAGGSIGSELCRQLLLARPRRLILFESSELALYTIERELLALTDGDTQIVPLLGSVTDARMVRRALARSPVDAILHAAAYKHVPLVEANAIAGLTNNVLGTRILAEAAVQAGVPRFLLVSTDKAVRPANVMGASKRLAEIVVQDLARRAPGTRFSVVRFGNVLGSSGSVVPLFKEQIARGGPVTVTDREVTRYFMTIGEAVRLVLTAGSFHGETPGGQADVFVLDMGQPKRIRDLAEELIHAAGYTVRDDLNPGGDIEIRITGLRPGEKLHEELLHGQGFLTTPHPKILRALEEEPRGLSVSAALQDIGRIAAMGDEDAARDLALSLVEPPLAQPALTQPAPTQPPPTQPTAAHRT